MLLPLDKLLTRANTVYRDPGWSRLRQLDADLESLANNKNDVHIPVHLINRVRAWHSGIAYDKLSRGIGIITGPRGHQLEIAKAGGSQKAEKAREQVRAWCSGFGRRKITPSLDQKLKWDMVLHARCAARAGIFPAVLNALTENRPDKLTLDVADARTPAEVWQRLALFMAPAQVDLSDMPDVSAARTVFEAADIAAAHMVKREEQNDEAADERRAAVLRRAIPITLEHVPVQALTWEDDGYFGIRETWEFRELPVTDVLANFLDADGKPLAQELARRSQYEDLSPSQTVVIVIRSDRFHLQIAIADMLLDSYDDQSRSFSSHNGDRQLLFEAEHRLGRVPYMIAEGRVSTSDEPSRKYIGLLTPGYEQFILVDEMETQMASGLNYAGWPQGYIKKHHEAGQIGTGDRIADFPMEEGVMVDATGPGESIERVPLLDEGLMRLLRDDIEAKKTYLEHLTFGQAVYGSHSSGSGYEYDQMVGNAVATVEPFRIGLERGYADLYDLVLKTASAGYQLGLPPIPVFSALPENRSWVELPPDLAATDWELSVTIEPSAGGGDLARQSAIMQDEERGYITHEEAVRRRGAENPQQVIRQVRSEKLAASQTIQQKIEEEIVNRLFAVTSSPSAGGMPANPMLSSALAGVLAGSSSPFSARLPGQQFGQPGVSNPSALPNPFAAGAGVPGAPNLLSAGGPPGPPQSPGMPPLPTLGGPGLPGAAALSPGGAQRQSQLNDLRQ